MYVYFIWATVWKYILNMYVFYSSSDHEILYPFVTYTRLQFQLISSVIFEKTVIIIYSILQVNV